MIKRISLSIAVMALAVTAIAQEVRGRMYNVKAEDYTVKDGNPGVSISARVWVENAQEKKVSLVAYFHDANTGTPLNDVNNYYCTSDGKVATSNSINANSNSYSTNLNLFIPYYELHLNGRQNCLYNLCLYVDNERIDYDPSRSFYYNSGAYDPEEDHFFCTIPGTDQKDHTIYGPVGEFEDYLKGYGYENIPADDPKASYFLKDQWGIALHYSDFSNFVYSVDCFSIAQLKDISLFDDCVSHFTELYGDPVDLQKKRGDSSLSLSESIQNGSAKYYARWEINIGRVEAMLEADQGKIYITISYTDIIGAHSALSESISASFGTRVDIIPEHRNTKSGKAPYADCLMFWHGPGWTDNYRQNSVEISAKMSSGIIDGYDHPFFRASEVEMLLCYFEYTAALARKYFLNQVESLSVRLTFPSGKVVGFEQNLERREGDDEWGDKVWLDGIGDWSPGFFTPGNYLLEVYSRGVLLFSAPFRLY